MQPGFSFAKPRLLPVTAFTVALLLALLPMAASAAEEEFTLFITGDKIDVIDGIPRDSPPQALLRAYYGELPQQQRQRLLQLQQSLASLMPDYEVAFTAADTAEVNSILSEVTHYWSSILAIHNEAFTPAVSELLRSAYGELYPLVALD